MLDYCDSKLANVLLPMQLAKMGVEAAAVSPGIVATGLFRELQLDWLLQLTTLILTKTPEEGAFPIVRAALAPSLPFGLYVDDLRAIPLPRQASDPEALWNATQKYLDQ